MMQLRVLIILGAVLVVLLTFMIGIVFGAIYSGNKFGEILMPFLSMAGTWAAGIGTLAAVMVALYIATQQARDVRLQGKLRSTHYAMVLVDELISRAKYQQRMLNDGGRPLAALYINTEVIMRRYEGLFQYELYEFLPGMILDSLKTLSARFFGLSVMDEVLKSGLNISKHDPLPANMESAKPICDELGHLIDDLELLSKKLYEFRFTFPENWHI
ncbi:MAG: hypothetical protein HZB47_03745 [Nitrosomonadales bacterium]|nr:hypothetical protein [Nitrosomonadales bacterium]